MDFRLRAQRALEQRYLFGPELGRGGMAVVYQAEDLVNTRAVAIKLLLPSVATHLGVERFVREITLAEELQHPNILPVLDTGDADGLPFYVMPFINGSSLRERLTHGGAVPLADAVDIAAQTADALAYAHARNIVHRDIKPENLLLDGSTVMVTDFGVGKALVLSGGSSLTETGFVVGTPAYMSPEQAAADPHLDGRSDLYSLGIVLYEMIGGRLPFTGKTAQQVIASRFLTRPVPLTELRPEVPTAITELVGSLLSVRASDRPAGGEDLARRLRTTQS